MAQPALTRPAAPAGEPERGATGPSVSHPAAGLSAHGLSAASASAVSASAVSHSMLGEEVLAAYDYTPATLAGLAAGFGMLLLLFWASTPLSLLLPWMALFIGLWLLRIVLAQAFRRSVQRGGDVDWPAWRLRWNLLTLSSAGAWGLSGWLFYTRGLGIQQTGLILVIYTFCIAVVPVLANQPRMFIGYVTLCFAPLIVRIGTVGDAYGYQLAGMLLIIVTLTTVLARNYRQALQRVIELKLRADDLLAQLRVEKKSAEEARREAEVANRAKTQFFAAASHDLRQPLHAMGLFAEALRQRTHDPEVTQLVNSINGSVDALEELFSELLDITRIDSGGIEVQPQAFEVGDILRKLKLHFEPTAFEKGLALRLRGGQRVVHADPLLVERILRNLVSNAIRYTDDGTVLVAARQRGDTVRLEVWDSGRGIRPEEQARVFEEFYQVPGGAEVAAHQRKGLGLGLAIVKRLADLMRAPLSLRSLPGRGSVFTLALPAGTKPRGPEPAAPGRAPLSLTLAGRLVVIVEDEPAVRGGLEVLLQGWGADVLAFDSVAETTAWAQAANPAQVRPDLLIVDYRLENGRNGVEAIHSLRQRFGATLPAIVVTGSTMSGHDTEAQSGNFHLLVKPVVPNKLRAMIAFKLSVKTPG